MKVCAIVNPVAGPSYLRPNIKSALALLSRFGWELKVLETDCRNAGTEFSRMAVEEGYDMIVACGGDGTINEVLQPLPGSGVALGVIPWGTANIYAREMRIPLNPLEAARVLVEGQFRYLDVGMADSRYFLLWAGAGFDAEVLLNVKPKTKRRLGIPAFVVGALRTAFKFDGARAEIVVDGQKMQRAVFLIVLSNIKHYALFELSAEAEPDDGLLDVCLFAGRGRLTELRHLVSFVLNRHARSRDVEFFRATSLTLESERPLSVQVDGDVVGQTPVSFRVVPRALRVRVPIARPSA